MTSPSLRVRVHWLAFLASNFPRITFSPFWSMWWLNGVRRASKVFLSHLSDLGRCEIRKMVLFHFQPQIIYPLRDSTWTLEEGCSATRRSFYLRISVHIHLQPRALDFARLYTISARGLWRWTTYDREDLWRVAWRDCPKWPNHMV